MNIQTIINYIMYTPENTNPAVLSDLIDTLINETPQTTSLGNANLVIIEDSDVIETLAEYDGLMKLSIEKTNEINTLLQLSIPVIINYDDIIRPTTLITHEEAPSILTGWIIDNCWIASNDITISSAEDFQADLISLESSNSNQPSAL